MNKPISEQDDQITFHSALSSDIDAFLWISIELERIWEELVISANDPDPESINLLAAEMYYVIEESKEFAIQCQEDLVKLEKEADSNEKDTVNTGDG